MTEFIGEVKPITVPVQVKDKWYEKLIELASVIYNRIATKIPDEQAYINKLATPSAEMWQNFVSPYWTDADLIKLKQRVKVSMAGLKYLNNVHDAFMVSQIFHKNVYRARYVTDAIDMIRYTLGGVGIRYQTGWGAIYKAVGVLTGDERVVQYMTQEDVWKPPVVTAFPSNIVKFVRPMLIAELTQGAVLAYFAIEKGLATLRDAVINNVNDKLNTVISALKSPEFTEVYIKLEYTDYDEDGTEELVVHAYAA